MQLFLRILLTCLLAFLVFITFNYKQGLPLKAETSGITTSATIGSPTGNLEIRGYASPEALVYFIENNSIVGTQIADNYGLFDKTLIGFEEGLHKISIYAKDTDELNTQTINFTVNIISNSTTPVGNIILPPTFKFSPNKIKRSAPLIATGKGMANVIIQIFIQGGQDNKTINTAANNEGSWNANINPRLHLGEKLSHSVILDGIGGISEYSEVKAFSVLLTADINNDDQVDLQDFNILMKNYDQTNPSEPLADINDDSNTNLTDLSIMMHSWASNN